MNFLCLIVVVCKSIVVLGDYGRSLSTYYLWVLASVGARFARQVTVYNLQNDENVAVFGV